MFDKYRENPAKRPRCRFSIKVCMLILFIFNVTKKRDTQVSLFFRFFNIKIKNAFCDKFKNIKISKNKIPDT